MADTTTDDDVQERGLWERDACICCENMKDMLRVDSNNRICDVCNRGPVCYSCYKGEWLDVCVCKDCHQLSNGAPVEELTNLSLGDEYKARFYKANLREICGICDKRLEAYRCWDCNEKLCEECVGICDECKRHYCQWCDNHDESVCAKCRGPEHADDNPLIEGHDVAPWDNGHWWQSVDQISFVKKECL
jgi:hypothetical protein